MINIGNKELNKIGHEIIDYISYNRKKDISSLIGQLVALQYNDYDSDSLYNIIDQLLLGNETDYTEISYYTISNPRVLAHYALWSAKYYNLLTK